MTTAAEAERKRKAYVASRRGGMPQAEAIKLAGIGRATAWRADKAHGFTSPEGPVQAGRVRPKPVPPFRLQEHRPDINPAGLPKPAGRTLDEVGLERDLERDRGWTIPDEYETETDTFDLAVQAALSEAANDGLRRMTPEPESLTPTEQFLGHRLPEDQRHPADHHVVLPRGAYQFGSRIDRYGRPAPPPPRTNPPGRFILRVGGRG